MWVFVLAIKNNAFQAFKKFKFLTKNKTEHKIRTLQTDRGDEFLSTEFIQFCENEGIERHLIAPYTTQQNGVVERRNCTVMAVERSLLKGTHMPARFWGEAIGRKLHLAHLRIFGCIAYVENTAPYLKKLDDRSSPMVYLGVEEGCKAHRVFDPRHGKLQVSRNVMFQENYEWTWNAGANNDENLSEFIVVDAFDTDEVIVAADVEVGAEHVTSLATTVVPMPTASSPTTPPSSAHAVTSPPKTVVLSSYEAEFMAATTSAYHALWLRSLTSELTGAEPKPVTLFVDNKSVIALMKNPVFHGPSKYIDTRFHLIRECIENGQIVVEFVNTGEQRTDVLTKALLGVKLASMRQLLGVRDLEAAYMLTRASSMRMICWACCLCGQCVGHVVVSRPPLYGQESPLYHFYANKSLLHAEDVFWCSDGRRSSSSNDGKVGNDRNDSDGRVDSFHAGSDRMMSSFYNEDIVEDKSTPPSKAIFKSIVMDEPSVVVIKVRASLRISLPSSSFLSKSRYRVALTIRATFDCTSALSTPAATASKKVADAKLAKDFRNILKELQKFQMLAAERATAFAPLAPEANLPSKQFEFCYYATEVDSGSGKTLEQRALLAESRRRSLVQVSS
ncbi:hypothetical protein ZIOFF_017179 [Zingiber officinale]|uniref:Integrase catalytic domain-containing protein n=1 Tax=Zingiber officinale TaxID=94328 RepID=A0A8J5H4F3_ZINOF|nr:hypothetical protein ZIOFF_017179 [Zingiber officinale]